MCVLLTMRVICMYMYILAGAICVLLGGLVSGVVSEVVSEATLSFEEKGMQACFYKWRLPIYTYTYI